MGLSLSIAIALGLLAGTVMALNAGRWPDRVLSVLTLLLYSVPGFWIGLMLIVLFSIEHLIANVRGEVVEPAWN